MVNAPTRRVIARTPPRAARSGAGRSGFAADCRWCKRPILWLRSTATDLVAPIDAHPAPGGNVVVHRDELHALPVGTYEVITAPRSRPVPQQDALLEREDVRDDPYADLGGGLDAVPDTDVPTRHMNHWATCSSATARRLARERADRGVPAGPLRTVDGDPVGPRRAAEDLARVDAFAPPAAVSVNLRRCRGCWQPMNADLSAAGERYHPTCEPEPPDPGPEPDR